MYGFYIILTTLIVYDMFGFYIVIKIINTLFIAASISDSESIKLENPIFDLDAVAVHYSNQDTWSLNVDKHAFPIHNPNQTNTPPDRWLRSGFQFPVTLSIIISSTLSRPLASTN